MKRVLSILSITVAWVAWLDAAEPLTTQDQPLIHPLTVKASFIHGADPGYLCDWTGTILGQLRQSGKSGGELQLALPVGLGMYAPSLSARWYRHPENKPVRSTGPICISLVKPATKPADLVKWTQAELVPDPALIIALVPSGNQAGRYSNRDPFVAKIMAWVAVGQEVQCLSFGELVVPACALFIQTVVSPQGGYDMKVAVQQCQIRNTSAYTWSRILQAGNQNAGMPAVPLSAKGLEFLAGLDRTPENSATSISGLGRFLLQLYLKSGIAAQDIKAPVAFLDAAIACRRLADSANTVMNLLGFCEAIQGVYRKGGMSPGDLQFLLDAGRTIIQDMTPQEYVIAREPSLEVPIPEGPYVTWMVRNTAGADVVPDGSEAHPYRTIADALAAADAIDSRGVTLLLDGGSYWEPLFITRDTCLIGSSDNKPFIRATITCDSPVRFEMQEFVLWSAPSPGALVITHPGAVVSLRNVGIAWAHRYGIHQSGGNLLLRHVQISSICLESGALEYGAGLVVENGAQAYLRSVRVVDCDSAGIVLRGGGSYLAGDDIALNSNRLHPEFYEIAALSNEFASGSFLVTDGARADVFDLSICGCDFIGLGVYRNADIAIHGADIHDIGEISMSLVVEGFGRCDDWGGVGIRARNGGHIEMWDFAIHHCDKAGVAVNSEGEIDLHEGRVTYNPIGAVVLCELFDYRRLCDRVWYVNNGINYDGSWIIPDVPPPF